MPAGGGKPELGIRPVRDPNCPVHGDKAAGKSVTADSSNVTADSGQVTADDGKRKGAADKALTADSTDVTADADTRI